MQTLPKYSGEYVCRALGSDSDKNVLYIIRILIHLKVPSFYSNTFLPQL